MDKSEKSGYYPYQMFKKAVMEGWITSEHTLNDEQFQPASLDLRIGERGWRIRSSFLPEGVTVERKLQQNQLKMYDVDLRDGAVLERGSIYLIPLLEEMDLPDYLKGETNPKSSTGRLDIFTRIVTDNSHRFDEVMAGYQGKMYLEVVTRSFTVKVKAGLSLNQLRLYRGDVLESTLGDDDLKEIHKKTPIIYDFSGVKIKDDRVIFNKGLFVSVSISHLRDRKLIGFKAKKNSNILDLSKENEYKVEDFWERVYQEPGGFAILEPEEFYILVSNERIAIPHDYVAEMVAYEPNSGELRTHYAGFFDPGFGYGKDGEVQGTKAILEVRPRDVPFLIEDGQTFCKLIFKRTIERPTIYYGESKNSHYQGQGLTLSKHFKPFEKEI